MVNLNLLVMNVEVAGVKEWIAEQEDILLDDLMSPVVTAASNRANAIYRLLGKARDQILQHEIRMAKYEEAHRRKGRGRA
jgi:hypothetical protein